MSEHPGIKKIKEVRALCERASARRKSGLFIVEGERSFSEIPRSDIQDIYVSKTFKEKHPEIKEDYLLDDKEFTKLSDTQHPQGILATVKQRRCDINDLSGGELYLILETIQDPGNLGTIMRTAEAAGVKAVIMSRDCADIYSPKVVRATMGALFRVPFIYVDELSEAAAILKKDGITIYAAHLKGTHMKEVKMSERRAFIIGNEGKGLTEDTAKLADCMIKIPMKGKAESLNAAIAAAILSYWNTI
ncbi:MAG: RNA methyltransferase [Lachnospiraceae bacterium]|nr:RNA methyltransferase [Lachnospiraceae bacterium]